MSGLQGAVALVTGGARGMGAAHAGALCEAGAAVIVADVLDEDGEATADELRSRGFDAEYARLDVRDPEAWARTIGEVETARGRFDVLVNNAGVISTGGAIEEPLETWDRVIAINQTGVFLGMKHAIPAMLRTGGGAIVNVSSVLGVRGASDYIAYQASKAAVIAMTRCAAITHAREGIRVNAVCPGTIQTPMHDGLPADANDEDLARTPMRRVGEPEEVSAAVVFLVGERASFVTGTTLHVDGGYLA
ncbi:MAG: SDR family oxidoreductase [Actinobacteria bacterium]|nr:SDR family oxidoreductase [Actinomycetota bacterium]